MKTIIPIFLWFFCGFMYSQTTVTGTVTDDTDQPIPGANVIVVGTTTGTVTDFDGNFSLTYGQTRHLQFKPVVLVLKPLPKK